MSLTTLTTDLILSRSWTTPARRRGHDPRPAQIQIRRGGKRRKSLSQRHPDPGAGRRAFRQAVRRDPYRRNPDGAGTGQGLRRVRRGRDRAAQDRRLYPVALHRGFRVDRPGGAFRAEGRHRDTGPQGSRASKARRARQARRAKPGHRGLRGCRESGDLPARRAPPATGSHPLFSPAEITRPVLPILTL